MKRNFFLFGLLFVCFFFAYFPVIYDLRDSVIRHELARHAPLVVALAGFLVYQKRDLLGRLLKDPLARSSPLFFSIGLFLNLLGQGAGVLYLSQVSIPLTLYGMASYLIGKNFARELRAPLLFLLLAFPIPGKIYIELVFPLKLLVTRTAGSILQLIGYDLKISGNMIHISSITLGVVDACSGLNSIMAIVTLAIFYSYLVIAKFSHRLIIVISMLPVIIIANIVRVTATAMVAVQWGPELAEGELHWIWGAVVFLLAVLGLLTITKLFLELEKRRAVHA